jgi:hypothetical protein
LALRLTQGYAAAAPTLARALERFLALDVGTDEAGRWLRLTGGRASAIIALELWDFESWHALAARQVQFARDTGALVALQLALNLLASTHLVAGELTAAARLLDEDRLIGEATGNPPVAYTELMLAAWRGREAQASALIEATVRAATAGGLGVIFATYASSVLDNGLGRGPRRQRHLLPGSVAVIDGGPADAGAGGDLIDGQGGVARLGQQLPGRGTANRSPRGLAARLCDRSFLLWRSSVTCH